MKKNSFWKMIPVAAFAAFVCVACDSGSSSDSGSAESSSSDVIVSSSSVDSSPVVTGTLTDSRDNQVYKTVTIGTQTWMAQNLNYAVDSSWCYENNCTKYGTKYGRLYQWAAAMGASKTYNYERFGNSVNRRGVCPLKWHLPTDDEWTTLETAVGGSDSAGVKLKSASGWYNSSNGIDSYGFSALPAGYRYGGLFTNVTSAALFWSATEVDGSPNAAYYRFLGYNRVDIASSNPQPKSWAFSVRCVQD